ncbi:MAG TPA: hypothetical protein VNL17_15775 [Verrucomicrobiae bacterium]|nr:hypothetical protein [Verrucomicrobiae bacterium]
MIPNDEVVVTKGSLKQLEGNRRNARRSTGPRTAKGKAASRMNAVKHGILSGMVVVRGLRIQEHEEEYEALRKRCFESLAPEGPVEEMLVERVVMTQWRLRRAVLAETGEIALSVDGGLRRREDRQPLPLGIFGNPLKDAAEQMEKTTQGLEYLTAVLKSVRRDVERDGELTEAACESTRKWFINQPNAITRELEGLRERMVTDVKAAAPQAEADTSVDGMDKPADGSAVAKAMADADGLSGEELKDIHQRGVLMFIDEKLGEYAKLSEQREEREDKDEWARQAADVLPSAKVLDKILRYEGALERQMYRALLQLERLQRRREGENVPPPVTMEVLRR